MDITQWVVLTFIVAMVIGLAIGGLWGYLSRPKLADEWRWADGSIIGPRVLVIVKEPTRFVIKGGGDSVPEACRYAERNLPPDCRWVVYEQAYAFNYTACVRRPVNKKTR